jgi:two-component system chemotaxis sensor kinase CheA
VAKLTQEQMLEMFVYETNQLLERLEMMILSSEQAASLSTEKLNELFRIMHTIKGSAAMMRYDNISQLAHAIEDLFFFIRENKPEGIDYPKLADLILQGADFIKGELVKLEGGQASDADSSALIEEMHSFLANLKNTAPLGEEGKIQRYLETGREERCAEHRYKAVLFFADDCEMVSVRAFMVLKKLKELVCALEYWPADLNDGEQAEKVIRQRGFKLTFGSDSSLETIRQLLQETAFLKSLDLEEISPKAQTALAGKMTKVQGNYAQALMQNVISVNILKLDQLMDLIGELVISEAMVTQNSDLNGLQLENFSKAARQLRKIIDELQDIVMAIRMVPLVATFQKLNRIVRDMCRKLDKNVELEIIGAETEVDKNVLEHLADPLIHIIRNSIDHGIEAAPERLAKGKPEQGKITLEAKNAGGDVLVIIRDDGRGLDRTQILARAKKNGLLKKPESQLQDQEIFSFIFLPGFSTNDKVTEFSGRGVGMDIVKKNIEKIGGAVSVDSKPDKGTAVAIKIPLTLAIIGGMNIKVGNCQFTIPITSIREAFRPKERDLIVDPQGNELLMIRGDCYQVLRLHQYYQIETSVREITEGIIIVVENDDQAVCLFADALVGEQQVVVKALPKYIKRVRGLSGCTLSGDGKVSLILDPAALVASA